MSSCIHDDMSRLLLCWETWHVSRQSLMLEWISWKVAISLKREQENPGNTIWNRDILKPFILISSGRPVPQVSWWHDNVQMNNTSIQIIDNRKVISTLQLGKLQRQDLHNSYVCQSTNNDVTTPLTNSITLDLNCKFEIV